MSRLYFHLIHLLCLLCNNFSNTSKKELILFDGLLCSLLLLIVTCRLCNILITDSSWLKDKLHQSEPKKIENFIHQCALRNLSHFLTHLHTPQYQFVHVPLQSFISNCTRNHAASLHFSQLGNSYKIYIWQSYVKSPCCKVKFSLCNSTK